MRRYVAVMEEIASRAAIADMDLIDAIIGGLQDKSSNTAVLLSTRSLKKFKDLLKRYEKKRDEQKQAEASEAIQNRSITAAKKNNPNVKRCFNCFKYGHISPACREERHPKDGCFNCRQPGHYVTY